MAILSADAVTLPYTSEIFLLEFSRAKAEYFPLGHRLRA